MNQRQHWLGKWLGQIGGFLLVVAAIVLIFLPQSAPSAPSQVSHYAIQVQSPFNQPQFYPLNQTVASDRYYPVGEWVGRLILPTQVEQDQVSDRNHDWVWMEVQHAPVIAADLIGKKLRLTWQQTPAVETYLQAVTRDVNFTDAVRASERKGNVHPDRLNDRTQVGALQSLAGTHPNDDLTVTLRDVTVVGKTLEIAQEPVLATGRFYGLVKILTPEPPPRPYSLPKTCPGQPPCASEFFRVQHYNLTSAQFDGAIETIRIPQVPANRDRLFQSTPRQLERSPAGTAGWYIYGANDARGMFTVQALEPRSLLQLQPSQVIAGQDAGLTYLLDQNWEIAATDKGTVRSVRLDTTNSESQWQEGNRAIVLHTFGGIGGSKAEPLGVPKTVTGHFAYGIAEVVRDPITRSLRFAIDYQQVYAHNPNGIVSASQTWATYMGNLQQGWLATRPVSDVLVKFEPVTQDYDFGGVQLSPLNEFRYQLQVMMARYRVGDGTGGATVTPATSCIQDSSQALYATIKRLKQQVSSTLAIQVWLQTHPNDPQTLRFHQLVTLGAALEEQLTPLGIVRSDWDRNADVTSGISRNPSADSSVWAGLTSWRTIVPRQVHDDLASLFFKQGAKLWFLRTNQVGGVDPEIAPLAPTGLLGQLTLPGTHVAPVAVVLNRVLAAIALPSWQDWLITLGATGLYGAIALWFGFRTGFLQLQIWSTNGWQWLFLALRIFFTPALLEEFIFRVLLLPHSFQVVRWWHWAIWALVSLLIFVAYHPFNAKTLYKAGDPTFFDRRFLILTTLLGLVCTVVYVLSGSLVTIVLIHWFVVLLWLGGLGGIQRLHPTKSD